LQTYGKESAAGNVGAATHFVLTAAGWDSRTFGENGCKLYKGVHLLMMERFRPESANLLLAQHVDSKIITKIDTGGES